MSTTIRTYGPNAVDWEQHLDRLRTDRLAAMVDIVGAVEFLVKNRGVNGLHLDVDGGRLLT